MPHFLIGLDEMCLMSDSHGDLRVVASLGLQLESRRLEANPLLRRPSR
jgi:hypothetical protein